MSISQRIRQHSGQHDGFFMSTEFFPPRNEAATTNFQEQARRVAVYKPLFAAVTCGAGGNGVRTHTSRAALYLQNGLGLETVAHMTCMGMNKQSVDTNLDFLRAAGLNNVMALRGDLPGDISEGSAPLTDFRYASDLVRHIRTRHHGLDILVAGYPHPHPEARTARSDLEHLKAKVDAGANVIVTQLFFDPRIYFDFVERLLAMGVSCPVIPGVLPVRSFTSLRRLLGLCGVPISGKFYLDLEAAHKRGGDDEVRRVGMDHAVRQIHTLRQGGAPGVHLYPLNRADVYEEIWSKVA